MTRLCALGCALWAFGSLLAAQRTARPSQLRAVKIASFAFAPAELSVSIGDTVRWTNDDPFVHTTTADSGAWASPQLRRGDHFVFVAVRAGRFQYHCDHHPSMRAVVFVSNDTIMMTKMQAD